MKPNSTGITNNNNHNNNLELDCTNNNKPGFISIITSCLTFQIFRIEQYVAKLLIISLNVCHSWVSFGWVRLGWFAATFINVGNFLKISQIYIMIVIIYCCLVSPIHLDLVIRNYLSVAGKEFYCMVIKLNYL